MGIPVTDTTPCLIEAGDIQDVFLPADSHYSPRGNAAVAQCVGAALGPMLEEQRLTSVLPASR